MTETKQKQRTGNAPGQGRQPTIDRTDGAVQISVLVSRQQRERYLQLGGSKWLRAAIDAAEKPEK